MATVSNPSLAANWTPQVSEAADPEDGDKGSGARATVTQRVECRDARAHERRRFFGGEIVRDARQRRRRADQVLGVAAIDGHPRDRHVLASDEVAAPAGLAVAAVASEPADSDSLARLPATHAVAHGIDDTGHLVPGNARVADARETPVLGVGVAVADAARLHPDAHLAGAGLRNLPLAELKWPASLGYLHDTHR
jgi:hypothetical protein